MISYLNHSEINKALWDKCLKEHANGLIYPFSWFLDIASPKWNALVYKDYEAVFPLPCRKKFGISYIYQPFFCQQLGPFGEKIALEDWEKALPPKFKLIDIFLNETMGKLEGMPERRNQVIDLNGSYDQLKSDYKGQLRRDINKSEKIGLKLSEENNLDLILKEFSETAQKESGLSNEDIKRFAQLFKSLQQTGKAFQLSALNSENHWLGGGIFWHHDNRLVIPFLSSNNLGKKLGATAFVIDQLIRQYSSKNMLLDFEGSEIDGVAKFFKGFGAEERNYYHWQRNKLNWPASMVWSVYKNTKR